ncbi:MAG: AI-2E family transporter [Chloroflexi bacterium]|nr:AI-2E family transporter [Chloroflexota bacterium]
MADNAQNDGVARSNTARDILREGSPEPPSEEARAMPSEPVAPEPDTPTTLREMFTSGREHRVITLDIAPAAIFKVLLTCLALMFVFKVWKVIILILFSLMLTAALNPVVRRLQKVFNRTWAVLAIVVGLIALIVGCLWLLVPSIYDQTVSIGHNAPGLAAKLQTILRQHHIRVNIQDQVAAFSTRITSAIPELLNVVTLVGEGIAAFVVVLVMAIYMLLEGPKVGAALARLLPVDRRLSAVKMVNEMSVQVGGYIRGQVIASLLAGVFSVILLYSLHIPNALALAVLAAVVDVLPLIGVLIATCAASLMALTAVSASKALIVLVLYLVYHQLESHVIIPQIYGSTLNLSLTVIVISILTGAELLGMAGIVLALPFAAATPSVLKFFHDWQEEHAEKDQGGGSDAAAAVVASGHPMPDTARSPKRA